LTSAYKPIDPPFSKQLRDMPADELDQYFRWLMDIIPERLHELQHAVRAAKSFGDWQPDRTLSSLDMLGEWFAGEVETRPRTSVELDVARSKLKFEVDLPREVLTDRTHSVAMDVGLYLSQVFLRNHPGVRWTQIRGNKRYVDFGHGVLIGFGAVPLNPVRIATMLAYGIADGEKSGKSVRELYVVWSQRVPLA
jgi:hypothetical protein